MLSGVRLTLPPCRKLYWPAGLSSADEPTWLAGTPVAMHSASLAAGSRAPSRRRDRPHASNRLKPCAVNSSTMLAARHGTLVAAAQA